MLPRLLFSLASILLLSTFHSHAQVYEPGLLVRSNGDTLRGEIENGFWSNPPTFIRFRPDGKSPEQLFKPGQLRAVQLTGSRYFRYEALPIDHAAETRLNYLKQGNVPDVRIDSLLAEVLLDGPATLLRVVRPGATHFLLRRPGLPVLELSERQYLRQSPNGSLVAVDGNGYRSQLELFFGDCPAALKALPATAFTAKALVALAQTYNETCTPTRQPGRSWLAKAAPRRRVAFRGGVLGGVTYNSLTDIKEKCVDCGIHPFAGLYAELLQPSRVAGAYGELTVSTIRGRFAGAPFIFGSPLATSDFSAVIGTATIGARFFMPLAHQNKLLLNVSYSLNAVFNQPDNNAYASLDSPDQRPAYASTGFPGFGVGWRSKRLTVLLSEQIYLDSYYHTSSVFGSGVATRLGLAYHLGRNPDAEKQQ